MKYKQRLLFITLIVSVFFSCASSAQNVWVQKSSFPGAARSGATGFVIGDNIYVTCGYDGANFLNDLWEYNTLNDSWTQRANLPATARYAASGFTAGLKGYVCCGSHVPQLFGDLWEYDPQTDSWTQKANFPGAPRYFAVAFELFNNIYFGTGALASSPASDMWMYDSVDDTWTQLADFPGVARAGGFGISNADSGYIGGGVAGTWNPVWLNDFWRYDPFNDSWSQVASFGTVGKSGHAAFVSDGMIITGTGGDSISGFTSDMLQYNSAADTWDSVPSFGGGERSYAVAFGVNGIGYMGTGTNGLPQNDWWAFQPPVGVNEFSVENEALITFPNPASDNISIVNKFGSTAEILILDLAGRIKKEFIVTVQKETISIADLEPGIYILKMDTGKKILYQKVAVGR